jgi:hypothetical protein
MFMVYPTLENRPENAVLSVSKGWPLKIFDDLDRTPFGPGARRGETAFGTFLPVGLDTPPSVQMVSQNLL